MGLISIGWYPLLFQRGPASWASQFTCHLLLFSGSRGFFSSHHSWCFYLSLAIHILPIQERQRKRMHMVAPCPSLLRMCGVSYMESCIPGNPVAQSLLPGELLTSPHGGLTGPAFTGSSPQSHCGAISPQLPGTTMTGSLIQALTSV